MAQPVWVLSVDLQTKTATFQSGLADAARSARGAFTDIKGGAGEAGAATAYSMMEARHSVMMLGEEFGVHLPRAVSGFIASIGPLGGALEAAFPFLAILAGATILIEHLQKVHEAGEKLTGDQINFLTASNNAFNQLNEKILQAAIRSDELRNDHLGALKHQLELIDQQSMDELVHSFQEVAKATDTVFKDLSGDRWLDFGTGAKGAQHALDDFTRQYTLLLSQHKDKEASDLLHGTLESAQKIRDMQGQAKDNQEGAKFFADAAERGKLYAALNVLKENGVTFSKDDIKAQEQLIALLTTQVGLEKDANDLKNKEKGNAKTQEQHDVSAEVSAGAKEHAAAVAKIAQEGLAAEKATAEASLTVRRGSLEEKLKLDIEFAAKDRDAALQANSAQIAALDKTGKDYQNQLKAGKDKALEIEAEYNAKVAEMTAASSVAVAARDLQGIETTEREKIAATQQGSAARVAAIDAAIKRVQSLNLQDTDFYRNLLTERVQAARQEAEQEGQLAEQAGIKKAEADLKQGELVLAAHKQAVATMRALQNVSTQQQISDETQAANLEFALQQSALQREIEALDKNGKEYQNKLKALNQQEETLEKQHQATLTEIKEKAEEERNKRILTAENQFRDAVASGLTQVIMGHESFAKMMSQLGDQVVSDVIKNTILILFQQDKQRFGDARTAASNTYSSVSAIPIVGPFLAPAAAAAAFTAVMAFQQGTDRVPGVGRGDTVPAMLEPGEGVVPGGVMDGLAKVARNGGFDQHKAQHVIHVHYAPTVAAFDSDGVDGILEKHGDRFQQHFERTLRRQNR